MAFKVGGFHPLVDEHLRKHRGVDVRRLFADGHFCDDFRRRHGERDTHTGGKNLGERTGVNDNAVFVHTLNRRQGFARHAQIAVGVVLQNQHAVFFGERIKLFAFFKRHRHARRVLEVRNCVNKADVFVVAQLLFEHFHVHAVIFDRHASKRYAVRTEAVERADERRRFGNHDVAEVAKGFGRKVHDLLRAGGDNQIIKIPADVVFLFHISGNAFPQRRIAFGHAVLQRRNRGIL